MVTINRSKNYKIPKTYSEEYEQHCGILQSVLSFHVCKQLRKTNGRKMLMTLFYGH